MSFYVKRENRRNSVGHSFIGPIRSQRQAERERWAWDDAGYPAEVLESTPEVRAEVRAWEKAKKN